MERLDNTTDTTKDLTSCGSLRLTALRVNDDFDSVVVILGKLGKVHEQSNYQSSLKNDVVA